MQTLKFKIKHEFKDDILSYQREYSSMLHYAFEYLKNEQKLDSLFNYEKGSSKLVQNIRKLNNIELMNSWFIQCAVNEAFQLVQTFKFRRVEYAEKMQKKFELEQKPELSKAERKELRNLQKIREQKTIFRTEESFSLKDAKTEFQLKSLNREDFQQSIQSGTAKPYKGNQKFRINEDIKHIVFQPDRKHHFELELIGVSKGYLDILKKLYVRQELKDFPITYKLTSEHIYISFEEDKLYKDEFNFKKIKDRYMALDLNPNYIGYSIVDWKSSNDFKVIESGVYSFKQINDAYNSIKGTSSSDPRKVYLNNKRNHEVVEVAKNLVEKCCYFKVESFVIEELDFAKDKIVGTNFNRLCKNQWIRNRFINNLKKRCSIFNINFMEVLPQYSSFVGNIMFRSLNLPDQVLSSIEIGRRGYEFRHQYILKDVPTKKNIVKIDINDDVFKELFRKSMEEFSIEVSFKDVIEAYWHFKRNPGLLYRIALSDINNINSCLRDFLNRHSRMQMYTFI